jgi:hypothetical protein
MRRASRLPVFRLAVAVLAIAVGGVLLSPATGEAATIGWTTQFGTSSPDDAYGVVVNPAGSLFVIGQTSGALPGQTNAGMIDAFLRRYDPSGAEVWTRQFGGGGGETAASVKVDRAGNAYVAGGTRAALPGQTNIGDFDCFIVKFDPMGADLWARQFGTTVEDYAMTVSLDGAGNPIVAGETSGHLSGAPSGGLDAFVRQYTSAGDVAWSRQFGSASDDYAVGSAVSPSGDVLVVGTTTGSLPGHKSDGDADAYIMSFSARGAPLWSRQFGTSGVDDAEAIIFDPTGAMFIAGRTGGPLRGSSSRGGSDAFLAATGPSGDILWVHQFGGPAEDYAMALAAAGNGGFYLAGGTTGALTGQKNLGDRDAFVVNIS